jgi:hypothetical protein
MSRTTIEKANLSLIVNGVGYEFKNLSNVTINDPSENTLSVSPQGQGAGVVYRTGTTSPVSADFVVREVQQALYNVLIESYKLQQRLTVLLYDQLTGDNYEFNESIQRTNPSNGTVAEGEEQLNVPFNIACPQNYFTHTPPQQLDEA